MSFPRYPAYKHSGVERLGNVPEHWEVVPVKRCLKSITQGWSPQCENHPAVAGQWGVLKVGCVNGGSFDPSENKALPSTLDPIPELSIRRRDVLLSRANTRELVGSVAVAERDYERLMLCDKLYRLRVDERRCDAAFLTSSLSTPAAREVIEATATGASSSMLNIGQAAITGMFIAVPPLKEQQALVVFIQAEAAKIDALIEEQRLLIELLREKRQAVISHAVTKGLDLGVPMKDSGVEWLGEVPAHWSVTQMRYIARSGTTITYGIVQAGPHVEDGVPYIKSSDMSGATLPLTGYAKTSLEIDASYARSRVMTGDLVMTIRASVGKCLPVPAELDGANLTQGTAKISPGRMIDGGFLLAYINSLPVQTYLNSAAKGATFKEITLETLRKTPALVPPTAEQADIASQVNAFGAEFQSLIDQAVMAVALLQERRSALISAAVTGKIDVRKLRQQEPA